MYSVLIEGHIQIERGVLMKSLLGGIGLLCIGGYLLLSNIRITSIGFYSVGRVSTGGILIVLLIVLIILAVMKTNWVTCGLVGLDVFLLIISVIMGTHFYMSGINAFELVAMVIMFALGIGLVLKGLLGIRKKEG